MASDFGEGEESHYKQRPPAQGAEGPGSEAAGSGNGRGLHSGAESLVLVLSCL